MSQTTVPMPRRYRTPVRCVVFVLVVLLLSFSGRWPQATGVVVAASPFPTIAASLATRTLEFFSLIGVAVIVITLVTRRWFCRWACPVGLMTECAGRMSPVSPTRCRPIPRMGLWIALLSFASAAVGYPLFLWLDPLAVFCGAIRVATNPSAVAAQASAAVLATLMIVSFLLPGSWCLKICPLGATQDLLAAPRVWLRRKRRTNSAAEDEPLLIEPLNRRHLLTTTVGAACAVAGVPLGLAARERTDDSEATTLRPPGAAPAWQFGQLCVRCGSCARVCPSAIIVTRWNADSWSDWLAPEISFDSDHCRKECTACMQACPSGALALAAKSDIADSAIGLAHVNMDRCLLVQGRECQTMCLTSCSYEAITLHEWTWEDDRRYPIVDADNCPGCGACQVACRPMDAIVVRPGR